MSKPPLADSSRNGATENRELLPVSELLELLLSDLDERNISYCVQRNYEGYPEVVTGDVDLVVSEPDMFRAETSLLASARRLGWECYHRHIWRKSAYLGLVKREFPDRFTLTVELFAGANWHGIEYLPAERVLADRMRFRRIWAPNPSHQAIITSLHHLLYGGQVPQKYRDEVRRLAAHGAGELHRVLGSAFGGKVGTRVAAGLRDGDWDDLAGLRGRLKMALVGRSAASPIKQFRVLRDGLRAKNRRPAGLVMILTEGLNARRFQIGEAALELADQWHLFSPPERLFVQMDDAVGVDQILKQRKVRRVVGQGGVVIVSCETLAASTVPHGRFLEVDTAAGVLRSWQHRQPNVLENVQISSGPTEAVQRIWEAVLSARADEMRL